MKIAGVYKVENRVEPKVYIGQSVDVKARLKVHLSLLRNKSHTNPSLLKDFNRLGEENFSFELVKEVTDEFMLCETERSYIYKYLEEDYLLYNVLSYGAAIYCPNKYVLATLELVELFKSNSIPIQDLKEFIAKYSQ